MMKNNVNVPPRAIYVHIPFCAKRCGYCDFTTYATTESSRIDAYLDSLICEMEQQVLRTLPGEIDTIFIGGGTPTLLSPSQMEKLLKALHRYFPKRSPQLECTVEANPGSTTLELLKLMRDHGVNRLSFGAQTFNPELLKEIGRDHQVFDIVYSVEQAREAGFTNISLDLMFGLPKQTVKDFEDTLRQAVALQLEHFSCYSLKVEVGTPFHVLQRKNQLPLPTEEEECAMYELARSYLPRHGYAQYEVSNFSLEHKESQHNQVYWHNQTYYGLGVGAHGYIGDTRYANVRGLYEYAQKLQNKELPVEQVHYVDELETMENFMILGLRLIEGISKQRFYSLYHRQVEDVFGAVLSTMQEKGFLTINGDRIRLTTQGLLFGNEVFAAFLGEGILR